MNEPVSVFDVDEREQIRSEFILKPGRRYLNYASVGPLPLRARRRIDEIYDTLQRLDRNFDPGTDAAAARSRAAMAALIGGRPEHVGLMANTSMGINWALAFFRLTDGDAVLITDHEFPALRYATRHLEHFGIGTVRAPVEPGGGLEPDRARRLFQQHSNLRLLAISWVSFHNGFRHDLKGLADIAHAHGAHILVDGTQGVGNRALDVASLDVDVLCCAAHKWLCCPVGQGFVWCRPELVAERPSPWGGWMSVDWHAEYGDLLGDPRPMAAGPRAAEAGTANFAGVRALAEIGEWLANLGPPRIEAHNDALLETLEAALDPDRFDVVSDRSPGHRSSIFCFRPRCADAAALKSYLDRRGFVTSLREGAVRVSPHFPTERAEIEQLVQSLHEFA